MSLRNVAIIAHVDHGKTTLVDQLFRQSGTFRENQRIDERAMDSGDLEKERGITILAKCTSIEWNGKRINIVDTPGHADFGGEVERILSMVDGVILLVDAAEGPMPQTKFVTSKALALGLKPIVVVNKIDRPDARAAEVLDEVFDLFVTLGASDEQLDFPVLYASGRNGYAGESEEVREGTLAPLFEKIVSHVNAPKVDADAPFRFLVTLLDRDNFVGRILTGRIDAGKLSLNQPIHAIDMDGNILETGRASKIMAFRGLERVPVEEASAGDIISLAGLTVATVANTIADPSVKEPIAAQPIDPPTLSMRFSVNDSPLAGKEGTKVTSRMIRDRLMVEAESNVAIRVTESDEKDSFEVAGRGELQLGVLIETMRREGFELSISRPRVLFTEGENGREEPYETVVIDVDDEFSGTVVEKMSLRKAELVDMRPSGGGKTRITFSAPSRGLIGYHGEFLSDTRGTGIMNRLFEKYGPYKGPISGRQNGVLISLGTGASVAFALGSLEERGVLFIGAGETVYEGMIIGENAREGDLEVNPLRAKQLTNMRSSGKDDAIRLTPPRAMTLEQAIAYIADDELVEVTPKSVRLRKRWLDPNERKRHARASKNL
ncbi:GTP-binding protein TypA/BipA [Zymomonas mobilis subsp. mobilis ZM4 = ATCC 31821]|uniref:Large ribosomal subunit assembly factor BipA n=4 Tax=Zymomonas mobilis TaxID=542 RepID=Q5NMG5_ZYMMO|nr:translational GTPase TypA [Zymomonas mobilis]AAV90095.1 GTP-binding protein TypA [Zymomonas mobilis subsp. mobilis ZM4 = ATCC 31821]ACV76258.1 GTP-binding protein TypA [Zymomonas mobilis subsp. mobilis NCIMB 11163]AEH63458.1 GTP-binding protein TypA [Zymomonas mobilis subsp. mobilis ATCC 10988]AHB10941.1 GTP-binding protein TypA/BipA [Zymomonas mobilis subsp. mobilis str. CP4 = NRRL B-14023]AHJ71253.1 Tyrosine phosphorylated protein A [Zymomonas mobilis subsp. mobilis NRRL B-12526]